jgi:hypothetical protein
VCGKSKGGRGSGERQEQGVEGDSGGRAEQVVGM